jgi:hypothetical protein
MAEMASLVKIASKKKVVCCGRSEDQASPQKEKGFAGLFQFYQMHFSARATAVLEISEEGWKRASDAPRRHLYHT